MTVVKQFFCDYCNPEQSSDADDGYARTQGSTSPLGWWEVPGKADDGTVGHACPACVLYSGTAQRDIKERRDAETLRRLQGVK